MSSRQDSTEGEDILLLAQENSTTVQECFICSAILLHTHKRSVYVTVAVHRCMHARVSTFKGVYLYSRCACVYVFVCF